jgi:DNA-binding transcriptional LysR family regulator
MRGVQHWFVSDVVSKLEVIRAGLGWGGLPHSLIARDLAEGTLVALDLPAFHVNDMVLSLLRRRPSTDNPLLDALHGALQVR